MKTDSEAAEKISDYLKNNKSAETGKTFAVFFKGMYKEFPVSRIPIKLLTFNLENTRFEVQKEREEKENGVIDPKTKTGKERLIKLLLYDGNKLCSDAKRLINDLNKNGQLEPGVITYDGAVINGNRRMACFIYLNNADPHDRYEYLDVLRLPEGTNEEEIFKVEAVLQWAKPLKVDYDPLNKYMMLKRALYNYKMNEKQIANLVNKAQKQVSKEIAELRLIEEYLSTTKDPENFSQLEGQTELITDAVGAIELLKQRGDPVRDIIETKKLIFDWINKNKLKPKSITYEHVRRFKKALKQQNKGAIKYYKRTIKEKEPEKVKQLLDKGESKVKVHTFHKKPDSLADELYDIAKKLKSTRNEQEFSKNTIKTIEHVIEMLHKILST